MSKRKKKGVGKGGGGEREIEKKRERLQWDMLYLTYSPYGTINLGNLMEFFTNW